jgi:hypothetical protein
MFVPRQVAAEFGVGDIMHIGIAVFGSSANGTGSGEGAEVGERD